MTPRHGAPPSPLRLARFERRVLAAITVVAITPIVAALAIVGPVLSDAYRVGVNGRLERQLRASVEAHREYFELLRDDAERTSDAISHDYRLVREVQAGDRAALRGRLRDALQRYPHVAEVRVEDASGTTLGAATRSISGETMEVELSRALAVDPPVTVHVRVTAPAAPMQAHLLAGETLEAFQLLRAWRWSLVVPYLVVFTMLLLGVVVVAFAAAVVITRRVTRRVVVLADATALVGRGDLSVEVPTDEADEVGELTRAFNAMVGDIRASRDRIEYLQRVGAWQEMARRLAHDIKNPLTPIQLAVQELHRSYRGDDPKFRRTLDDVRDIVEEEVTTLRRLVKEFSEFARLPEPVLEPAELGAFVRDAMRAVDPAALASEASAPTSGLAIPEVRLEISEGVDLPVKIDGQMLRRCLDNLVRNAVQAIAGSRASNGPGGRVIVATRADRDHALLEVRDDGPGVPPGSRERVFDPYFTTRQDGTGLGLAIVKKVVLEHGGSISCGEAPEGGAAFRIRLPLDRDRRSGA